MILVDKQVREAELAFLNAPFQTDGWHVAIRQLAFATKSEMAQLCGGGADMRLTFNHFSAPCDDPHGHLVNPKMYGPENWRINCRMGGARTIQHEHHYAVYRSANRTDFYDDAVSDLDLPYGCQSPLLLDESGLVGLALLRSSRDGPCSPEVIAAFSRIARQAHRAVRVQLALGEEAASLLISDVSDRTEVTIVLDGQMNVLALTELAEALFDQPQGLRLEGLRLALAEPRDDRLLRSACQRLLASDGIEGPTLHETRIGRSPDYPDGRWRAVIVLLGGPASPLGVEAKLALTLTPIA